MKSLAEVETAINDAGLSLRGALGLTEAERVGPLAGVRTIVLIGMVGVRNWPAFAASHEFLDGAPDPLDRFSARVIGGLARDFGATALFPFGGPPYLPFQRWAQRAEPVRSSPLGLLAHPEYGLWHSYRGALGFAEDMALPPRDERPSPCESCAERPCLTACPVDAFSERGYDVEACASHLRSGAGQLCMTGGCLARRICPAGREHRHSLQATAFHMAAFLRSRG